MNLDNRIQLLKAMNLLILALNNEDGQELWLTCGVPDGATEDDYEFIAENDDLFHGCERAFYVSVKSFGKDGWYVDY